MTRLILALLLTACGATVESTGHGGQDAAPACLPAGETCERFAQPACCAPAVCCDFEPTAPAQCVEGCK